MTSLADALTSTGMIPPMSGNDLLPSDDQKKPANSNQQEKPQNESDVVSKGFEDIKGELRTFGEMKPPEMIPYKEAPKSETSDPVQQGYVSAIGIMGAIASAFTRKPMVNSMNSAAAVLKSMKEGDQEAFKQNMDKWKIDNENIKNMNDYQHQLYQDILDNKKIDLNTKMSMLNAQAIAINDVAMQKVAQSKLEIDAQDLQDKRADTYRNYQLKKSEAERAATEFNDKQGLFKDIVKSHPEWTPEQKAQEYTKIMNPSVAAADLRVEAAAKKSADKNKDNYEEASSMIDDLISKVEKGGGMGVTGLAGFGQRVAETVATVVPTGANVPTPASDFESQLDTVKLELPKLLTGTSKSAADERAKISTILRGVGPGDTKQKTINSLKQVKEIFDKRRGEKSDKEETDSQYNVGDVVTAPDGTKKKITGFDDDGTPLGETVQ